MAVKTKQEILEEIKSIVGERSDDAVLKLLEDVFDTFDSYEAGDTEDWKQKYYDLDNEWRVKYRERFYSGEETETKTETPSETEQVKTIEELFD